jgi:hypothetical protein
MISDTKIGIQFNLILRKNEANGAEAWRYFSPATYSAYIGHETSAPICKRLRKKARYAVW